MAESPWGGAHPEIPVSSYLSGILSAFSFSLGTIRPQFQVHSANRPFVLGSKLTKELIFFGQGGILELWLVWMSKLACLLVVRGQYIMFGRVTMFWVHEEFVIP